MQRGPTGRWQPQPGFSGRLPYQAFVPDALPPVPALQWDAASASLLAEASAALGRLDVMSRLLPEPHVFLYPYIRREAVLSSQIEGTQSSLADLLTYENDATPGVPLDDVKEVSCYVAALEEGIRLLEAGRPLSARLLLDLHRILLGSGRGANQHPGELRTGPVWIGGTEPARAGFVPPPAREVPPCLAQLEAFINDVPDATPALVKAALAHVQFETIHPFNDGNGRLGRLLIALILHRDRVLRAPLLYLSLYFKAQRSRYYDLLQMIRTEGDWEAWLVFFLSGVRDTAEHASATALTANALFASDRERIQGIGRAAGSALRVHQVLQAHAICSIARVAGATGLSEPAIARSLEHLVTLGIAREVTGRQRGRLFAYQGFLELLDEPRAG